MEERKKTAPTARRKREKENIEINNRTAKKGKKSLEEIISEEETIEEERAREEEVWGNR